MLKFALLCQIGGVDRQMDENRLPIYLDYSSTTPTDQRVLDVMIPYFIKHFGNPHSSHLYGTDALKAIKTAREQVADLIGSSSEEIIFTSGATEANNIAIRSSANLLKRQGKNHLITTTIEHKSVLETFQHLSGEGFEVTYLDVNTDGLLDIAHLNEKIKPNTGLISVISASNEIGVVQPLKHIAEICNSKKILFHTDAVQAIGKIPLNVHEIGVDLLCLSGHKMYGPKGIGAFYANRKMISKLRSISYGGDQEFGLRPGTLPTPLCVGLGEACSIAKLEMDKESSRLLNLRNIFLNKLKLSCKDFFVNGSLERRLPGSLSISFAGVDAEALIISVKNKLAISTGSACTSSSIEPSHVLLAIGLDDERAESTIRITFGRFTTEQEVLYAVDTLVAAVSNMRRIYR